MKLLFCPMCYDVFKLTRKVFRSCKCGNCKGKYNKDGHTAIVNGKGLSFAINNRELLLAYHKVASGGNNKTSKIECWARPHTGKHNPNTTIKEDNESLDLHRLQ